MPDLLTECREAAPEWMAREGWEWTASEYTDGAGADHPCGMRITVDREGRSGVYVTGWRHAASLNAVAVAQGPDLSRALAYVAGEVRTEMVARGMAKGEGPGLVERLREWTQARASLQWVGWDAGYAAAQKAVSEMLDPPADAG